MEPETKTQKRDRTAEWIEQQSAMKYSPREYDPSPSITIPSSVSRTGSSSTRTTSFSEQSSAGPSTLKRRGVPPSPSMANPIPSPIAPASSSQEQRALPFPRSPPGSGYPMAMEVASPRVEVPRPSRPSLLKKRRPSIAEQVKSFGSSNVPWKRDELAKR